MRSSSDSRAEPINVTAISVSLDGSTFSDGLTRLMRFPLIRKPDVVLFEHGSKVPREGAKGEVWMRLRPTRDTVGHVEVPTFEK